MRFSCELYFALWLTTRVTGWDWVRSPQTGPLHSCKGTKEKPLTTSRPHTHMTHMNATKQRGQRHRHARTHTRTQWLTSDTHHNRPSHQPRLIHTLSHTRVKAADDVTGRQWVGVVFTGLLNIPQLKCWTATAIHRWHPPSFSLPHSLYFSQSGSSIHLVKSCFLRQQKGKDF